MLGYARRPTAASSWNAKPAAPHARSLQRPHCASGNIAAQAKLLVGPVDDPLEREADAVAEHVMRAVDPTSHAIPPLARGPHVMQRACAACEAEEKVHAKRDMDAETDRNADSGELSVPASALATGGAPLPPATRSAMERSFGVDFAGVRVHDDSDADRFATDIRARAFTYREHIFFGRSQFQPASAQGQRLLAHELAHVVQQGAASRAVPPMIQRDSDDSKDDAKKNKPLIPIPVFDQVDPTIIVPDVPGIPPFLRGQQVKLSDVQKALEIFNSKGGAATSDDCKRIAGMQRAESGTFKGMCCTGFFRDAEHCCKLTNIDLIQSRCCTPQEIAVQGRCIKPQVVVPEQGKLPGGTPTPPVTPAPAALPIPLDVTIYFQYDQPQPGPGAEASLTVDGAAALERLAAQLRVNPSFKVQLTGKASSEGSRSYNEELGARRAKMVADALVTRGIDRGRVADAPDAAVSPGCKAVGEGLATCGKAGASKEVDPVDRQVYAHVFAASATTKSTGAAPAP
jgi:hypothetical protein